MNSNGFHILIVDDEPNIRAGLAKGLSDEAAVVDTAKDGEEALAMFDRTGRQLVIADLKLPGTIDGMELLRQIKHKRPETVVVVITAHSTVENAVEAMRRGVVRVSGRLTPLPRLARHAARATCAWAGGSSRRITTDSSM